MLSKNAKRMSTRQLNIATTANIYVLETDDATACISDSSIGSYTLSFWAICLPGFDDLAECTLQVAINKGIPGGIPRTFNLVSTWKEYSFQF
jgi:hypothetical protein